MGLTNRSFGLHHLLVAGLAAAALHGQCEPQWQHADALPYIHGSVRATTQWDPDGAGPNPSVLVVGGQFDVGNQLASHVVAWDGVHYATIGALPGSVAALTTWNGQLVAAATVGGNDAIYVWSGTTWQLLGVTAGGSSGSVKAMAAWNGDLFVGGSFSSLGVAANNIARWNGSAWSPLGSGTNNTVFAMLVFQGLLHVGGQFLSAGGVAVGNLAAWNGSTWLATAGFNGPVLCLAVAPGAFGSEFLWTGGSFTSVGGTPAVNIAKFSTLSFAWSAAATGLPSPCVSLAATPSFAGFGDVVAAVQPASFNPTVWRWTGLQWSSQGTLTDTTIAYPAPTTVTWFGSDLVVALQFGYQAIRRFDFVSAWPPLLGFGLAGSVLAIDAEGSDVVIGGTFATISGLPVNCIARGSPGAWQPLGSGVQPGGLVYAIARTFAGDVIAGGSFASAGGVAANNVARWNGASWSPLGGGVNGTVYAMRRLANGDILAAGAFTQAGGLPANNIARWNGATWSALGSGTNGVVNAVTQLANGDVVAGGQFTLAGGNSAVRIARWNGLWSGLGNGFDNTVYALTVANGALVAGGSFTHSGATSCSRVAQWVGGSWVPMLVASGFQPSAPIYSLLALPDGDLVAGGMPTLAASIHAPFTGLTCLMRKDAAGNWSNLEVNGQAVYASALTFSGSLLAAGEFWASPSAAVGNVDRLAPTCGAGSAPFGSGCASSAGPVLLNPINLPWLGSTYRSGATGVPASGICIMVTGFSQVNLPISALLPQGLPGCSLLVSLDITEVLTPTSGQVTSQLTIPPTPTLVGLTFFQQASPWEFDTFGNLQAISASNGLSLTIGVL